MLGVGNTAVGTASSLPLDVRVAVGAGVFAAGPASSVATTADTTQASSSAISSAIPTFSAFKFVYRPDYGQVVLLWENANTGQEISQVPSEYHLQQYAATQREEQRQQFEKLVYGTPTPGSGLSGKTSSGSSGTGAAGGSGGGTRAAVSAGSFGQGAPAPTPAPAPAASAAPATPVDIKV